MATRKQNSRGDFTVSHKFYKDGAQVDVPAHLEVQYYTDEMCGKFIVERNGDKRKYCSISDDGKILSSHLALSEKYIGNGQLRYILIEYVIDSAFPKGERACPVPGALDVLLWTGATDDDTSVLETSTLQSVVNNIQGIQAQIKLLTPQRVESEEVMEKMIADNTFDPGQLYYIEEE
ncbi:MAG: hypothetical protein IKK89_07690 [Alistipes sp.]|nr:hypothetical protein [Alistipes sp.]MBR6631809.1 hypothetical protein [Alistipes sp.]MBR6720524.1 hypothetical protein [Alistipes sp.]